MERGGGGWSGPSAARLSRTRLIERWKRHENVRQIVDRRVPGTQRGQAVTVLDRREDRGRVVLRVIDHKVALQTRRDDQRGDPRAGSPLVVRARGSTLSRRGHMVPLTAKLVVGHYDHGVLTAAAVLDRLEQADQVVAAAGLAGVAGVLVLEPDRLD